MSEPLLSPQEILTRFVAVSGGKDSTAMALRLKEVEPDCTYRFLITPTGRELPAMNEHWTKLEDRLGQPLERVPAPTLVQAIVDEHALPNWRMRFCTRRVKIEPFIAFVSKLAPATTCIGIRADEVDGDTPREGTDWNGVSGIVQDFPLVRWGWGLNHVIGYLQQERMIPPPRTDCDWCFYQRLIEWYELWRDHPERYREGIAMEKLYGHTFRSPQRDSWPASMEAMALRFASGDVPRDTRLQKKERTAMCAWCAR